MANMRVSSATHTDMTNAVTDYSIDEEEQDFPGTEYTCNWAKWFGYYKVVPELQAVIDKLAMWVVGKGYQSEKKEILDKIKGNGKDCFNSIIFNLVRTAKIGGDAYAEIIKNKRGELINLKPINPGTITIQSNEKGMITGYTQNLKGGNFQTLSFSPDEIFHLSYNRLGDECHGRSTIEKMEDIILMKGESMADLKMIFHRYVKPLIVVAADTDDTTEMAELKAKLDQCVSLGENMVVSKDSMEMDRMSIPQYSTLDPLPWLNELQKYFLIAEGVPEIVLGYGRDTTESSSKILYLAFQQVIEFNQLFLEEQIRNQLGLKINFEFPADLMASLQNDQQKDGQNNFKKSDVSPK